MDAGRRGTAETRDRHTAFLLGARLLLVSAFIVSGMAKLLNFPAAIGEVRALTGLEPASLFAASVVAVQLGGAGLVLVGRRPAVVGALLLAGFTLIATFLAHTNWVTTLAIASRDAATFFEHLGLIGGFILLGHHDWSGRNRG